MNAQALAERTADQLPTLDVPATQLTPMQMAYQLISRGADIGAVKEMLAVSKELAADNARRAFDAALSAAKAEIPPILKNRAVDFVGKTGIRTNYRHEDLGEIARTVDPILARHGLSYRFRTEQQDGGGIRVTCVVGHRDGHSENNSLTAGRDESGNKNNIQAVGSTITYLQRYTLKAALGLAASNDDDGRSAGGVDDKDGNVVSTLLTSDQVEELKALIDKAVEARPGTSHADWLTSYLEYMKVDALNDIPAKHFAKAKATILNAINEGGK